MADAEIEAAQPAPAPEGVEEEEDEVFLDTTMFDEDDEWLEGALAAPEDEDDDPYYFVQARRTGRLPSLKLIIDPCCCKTPSRTPGDLKTPNRPHLNLLLCQSDPLACPAGPKADIYHAARVGDLERIKHLVEDEEVDVNRRDRWDSVPLYYACLAGARRLEANFIC